MCGIFAYLKHISDCQTACSSDELQACHERIKYRGPDDSKFVEVVPDKLWFGFHRLAINGLSHASDEPLKLPVICSDPDSDQDQTKLVWLICNGEIFNWRELIAEYQLEDEMLTKNDCEIILHLYVKLGFLEMLKKLDGVFAIVLYDERYDRTYVANDPIGIRPLYCGWTIDENTQVLSRAWASEPIALKDCCSWVEFFPPGHWWSDEPGKHQPEPWYHYQWSLLTGPESDLSLLQTKYRDLLISAVKKRIMGERPIACLLSGGLDSSLVSAIVAQELPDHLKPLHTFSIGMPGSPDLLFAKKVADHIGSVHHHIEVGVEEFLAVIPEVIRTVQSPDITTIRASCGNYLIAKYIAENTDFKIIFNGDVSEEINASYYYSKFAPTDLFFYEDNVKLIKEVHAYDVCRSARCVEHFGLDARTPFADRQLVNFVMSIPIRYKRFGSGCFFEQEKGLLRSAFSQKVSGKDWLPPEVLFRPKTAFSDGVSAKSKSDEQDKTKKPTSWHEIVKSHTEQKLKDAVVNPEWGETTRKLLRETYGLDIPTAEAYYYWRILAEYLGWEKWVAQLIPCYWMPRFVKATDPSARELVGNES